MTPERRREIASRGGISAHAQGKAHTWKVGADAKAAGRKGGLVKHHGKNFETPVAAPNTVDAHEDDVSRFHDEGNPND